MPDKQDKLDIEATMKPASVHDTSHAPATLDIETTIARAKPRPSAAPSGAGWYYKHGGEEFGPVSTADLKSCASSGRLLPTDQIRREGTNQWAVASRVQGLFSASSAPSAATGWDGQSTLPIGYFLDDKFVITRLLGKGGRGLVYKASERQTGVEFAIKVVAPELIGDAEARNDLRKEVVNAQRITHQNLLKVNYLADSGPITYLVMECIDSENLEEYRVRKGGRIASDDFRKIAAQVLTGLDYLHDKGVVHCDVKPQNVMVTPGGEVKITDYGIARTIKEQMTKDADSEASAGTLAYMAPEQIRGESVCDRRADIYSLGIVFYRLLTGAFPFDTRDRRAIIKWHIDERHTLPAGAALGGLAAVIQKALATDPLNRFMTCGEMLVQIERLFAPAPSFAPQDQTNQSHLNNVYQSLLSLRASGASIDPVTWYKLRFRSLFALPSAPFIGITILMWMVYGFFWIPAWFLIDKVFGGAAFVERQITNLERQLKN